MDIQDPKWEFDCPQYIDFTNQNELESGEDDADRFFDNLEQEGYPFKRILREVSNTQHNVQREVIKKHIIKEDNCEVADEEYVRFPIIRPRARWPIKPESLHVPLPKKARLSSPDKPKELRPRRRSTILKKKKPTPWVVTVIPAINPTETPQDNFKEIDFVSTLRCYSPPRPVQKTVRITRPEPFKLSGNTQRQSGEIFKSMAQQAIEFQTKTPQRFHTKRRANSCDSKAIFKADVPKKTMLHYICSPKLQTKARRRSPSCLSRKEMEDREIEEMKKSQFHANPVRRDIFEKRDLGVPKVEPKRPTVVEPFNLCAKSLNNRNTDDETGKEDLVATFKARPVPKGLFERVLGIPDVPHAKATVAQSPHFSLRGRRHLLLPDKPFTKAALQSLNHSMVSTASSTAATKWDPKPTIVAPFGFDQRDKERQALKRKRIEEILEQERRLREFHANPLPDLAAPVGIPPKKVKPPTICKPFQAEQVEASRNRHSKWMREMEETLENWKKQAVFKAKPCTVTRTEPFIPVKQERTLTEPTTFTLKTEDRAREREEFDAELKEKEARMEELRNERNRILEIREKEEIKELRANAVHVAQPVRHYKGVGDVKPRPLTLAISPEFQTKNRCRKLN